MIYPNTLQVETTQACNAHCSFCPHASMSTNGKMPDEMFFKIVDEIATWPQQPGQFCPFLTNEPFADSRIFRFCQYINEKLPHTGITFFTNASLLSEKNITQLLELRNVIHFFCSVHHSTAEEYQTELGLSFDRTVANIKALLARKPPFDVTILRVSDNNKDRDLRFCQFVEREFPTGKLCMSRRWNWKGDIASDFLASQDIICPRHGALCILHDGRTAMCCMDQNGEFSWGDTKQRTLLEIYNSPERLAITTKPKRESSPCNRCNMC